MKRALLIGINDYPGFPLKGCIEDINQLEQVIARNGDGSKNFHVKKLPNIQSCKEVMDNIEQLFHDDCDAALFYFSGLGYINTTGGEIVMPDSLSETSYYTGIQMSSIMEIVNNSKVKNKIVILDCCHSGEIGRYKIHSAGSDLYPGVSILTACRNDETAMEIGGHGIFTELLCDALKGGAADFSGNISIGNIYAYIDRSLGAWAQRPVFKTNVSEFIPIKTVQPKVGLDIIRQLTNLFANPNDEFRLNPSFEDTNTPSCPIRIQKPYAVDSNVKRFKLLQQLQGIGFVEPIDEKYMYFAAMNSKSCRLTALGKYYWRLVKFDQI